MSLNSLTQEQRDIIAKEVEGKGILITGGTGSFGQTLARTLLENFNPRRLVIFSRDEYKQYLLQQKLPPEKYASLRFFIGDVRDKERLALALRGIDTVIHAAALKHVTAAEYNPFECVQTNVNGAQNLAYMAIQHGVSKVIALSTDKAASPVNLYGATKLVSDKIFIASNMMGGGKSHFSVVRYGNVFGSRGSVVPYFRQLVEQGSNHIPITDPNMTRFFITLQEGVNFVLRCLSEMKGGEVFVPKIPSVKITDLATAIAPELEQRIIGIRPGEKMHEVMITEDDARQTLELPEHFVIAPNLPFGDHSYENPEAHSVNDNFSYRSNINNNWLDVPQLNHLLETAI